MLPTLQAGPPGTDIGDLTAAFHTLNRSSERLEQAYRRLVARVQQVDRELVESNQRLNRKVEELDSLTRYLNDILAGMDSGVVAGFPVVDVRVELVDGSYHDVDSSEMAFQIAGSMAAQEALKRANPVLLEPIMDVEVVVPEEFMGDVMGDLSSRRGQIQGMDSRGGGQVIRAMVPLSEMFGYATSVRSKTQGRATFTMQFDHYDEVPKSIAQEIAERG